MFFKNNPVHKPKWRQIAELDQTCISDVYIIYAHQGKCERWIMYAFEHEFSMLLVLLVSPEILLKPQGEDAKHGSINYSWTQSEDSKAAYLFEVTVLYDAFFARFADFTLVY